MKYMELIRKLEEVLDERRNYLCECCNKVYFMVDLETFTPEDDWPEDKEYFDDTRDLSEDNEHYMMLEPCNRDFHYSGAEDTLFGLSAYLDKNTEGLDKNDIPLIAYETTDDNKLLFTCYVDKNIDLKSKPAEGYSKYKNLNIIERLEKYIDGQISDGWGENGLFLYHFIGCPAIIAYARNIRRVEKKYKDLSIDYTWEKVSK